MAKAVWRGGMKRRRRRRRPLTWVAREGGASAAAFGPISPPAYLYASARYGALSRPNALLTGGWEGSGSPASMRRTSR